MKYGRGWKSNAGSSFRGMKTSDKTKVLDFALLNTKALIAKKLAKHEPIRPGEIRGILLGAAGRYAAFSLKIPSLDGSSWTFAAELIKCYRLKVIAFTKF
ncbi:Uncharacterized protein FKW44_024492 [Caligus rogercresseyi]|uniref:Uncharacterized protein n=1 Tax=Caligus rogercresseyi TaxID=217165 RepID=A0A7T8JTW8_CALRO|nr:Uncharacterized protein FKW44_024492 [Caligus rogercresseyi]